MTKSFLVSVGIFIGAGAMFAVMGVYEKLDDGISRT
jgi:ABC-type antimicrobial peptide transport system permease subunit